MYMIAYIRMPFHSSVKVRLLSMVFALGPDTVQGTVLEFLQYMHLVLLPARPYTTSILRERINLRGHAIISSCQHHLRWETEQHTALVGGIVSIREPCRLCIPGATSLTCFAGSGTRA